MAGDTRPMISTPDAALRGRVAVVAGATRGAGRGIATALGEAGATVICTGRSSVAGNDAVRLRPAGNHRGDRRAGHRTRRRRASPIQVDHLDTAQVRTLAERIRANTAPSTSWSTTSGAREMLKGAPPTWNRPMWEHDLDDGLRILRLGIDTHLITSHRLLPLLVDAARRPARGGHRRHHGIQRRQLPASRCSTTWPRSR